MAYSTAEAQQEMLDDVAVALDDLAVALADLGEAYELLDDATADRLEGELFKPVQLASGRLKRTAQGFAERMGRELRAVAPATPGHPSQGVRGFVDRAGQRGGGGRRADRGAPGLPAARGRRRRGAARRALGGPADARGRPRALPALPADARALRSGARVVATPALLLDPDALGANLAAMAATCAAAGVALRPHVKGHKCAAIARRQLEAGAVGVATATLREAAAMVDGGVGDVLVTSVLPPARAADAVALALRAEHLALVVHDPALVGALGVAARGAETELGVLLDLDVGQRRGGVAPGSAARALADAVAAEPGLVLRGVQGYEGHLQGIADPGERAAGSAGAMALLGTEVDALRAAGHDVGWVTTGGTGTAALAAPHPAVTEVQPGSYALMDAAYARVGGVTFAQAVHVEASVLAVLSAQEVIVDAGTKALSTDAGPAVPADLDARYEPAGDEHGRLTGALAGLALGRPGAPRPLARRHDGPAPRRPPPPGRHGVGGAR